MTVQTVFQILVLLYAVTNMASLGLELNLRATMKSLRSAAGAAGTEGPRHE